MYRPSNDQGYVSSEVTCRSLLLCYIHDCTLCLRYPSTCHSDTEIRVPGRLCHTEGNAYSHMDSCEHFFSSHCLLNYYSRWLYSNVEQLQESKKK